LLTGFLTIRDACPACGLDYSFAEPADGPAFFGMTAVGIIGMALFMWFEFTVHPAGPRLSGRATPAEGLAGVGAIHPQGRAAGVREQRQARRGLEMALTGAV